MITVPCFGHLSWTNTTYGRIMVSFSTIQCILAPSAHFFLYIGMLDALSAYCFCMLDACSPQGFIRGSCLSCLYGSYAHAYPLCIIIFSSYIYIYIYSRLIQLNDMIPGTSISSYPLPSSSEIWQ